MSWNPKLPIETRVALAPHATKGMKLDIGQYSYGHPALLYNQGDPQSKLTIGKYCSIHDSVKIFVGRFGRHPYDFLSTYPIAMLFGNPSRSDRSIAQAGDLGVRIGSDVWIARDVTIMAGVTIGHGAVIGASSLVTKDVAPYTIVGGVPARPLKKRFSEEHIARLLKIQWWDWPDEELKKRIDLFYRADIGAVIDSLENLVTVGAQP